MSIRIYWVRLGGHVHCRVFTGKGKNMTHACCGTLVFSEEEWDDVRNAWQSSVEFFQEAE